MKFDFRPLLIFGTFLILLGSVVLGVILPHEKSKNDVTEDNTTTASDVTTEIPPENECKVVVTPLNFVRSETDRGLEVLRARVSDTYSVSSILCTFWRQRALFLNKSSSFVSYR